MILIADCGSTKIDWCVVNGAEIVRRVFTGGMNAVMLTEEEMAARIASELIPQLGDELIDEVYFYGAGCLAPEVCDNVRRAIAGNIPTASKIEVDTDLLAAARALCGHNPGIACIMGTGSNSCYYDGERICDNVSPLGYILGDEGSGAVLGKLLIGDVLKNQLPADLCEKFLAQYQLDRLTIIRRVYKEPQANRFLASVTPFLIQNIERKEIHDLVLNSFKAFFRRNVLQYKDARQLSVNLIGSIIKSPMEGLVAFHCS